MAAKARIAASAHKPSSSCAELNGICPPKSASFSEGPGRPSNVWFLLPTRVCPPNDSRFCTVHRCAQHTDNYDVHAMRAMPYDDDI